MPSSDVTRQQALAHLDTFVRRILPRALRRIAAWKSHPPSWLTPWRDDLRQELAVDCLRNADLIVALDERERHRRWLRLAERALRMLTGDPRRRRQLDPDLPAAGVAATAEAEGALALPWHDVQHLLNGRLNLSRTHRKLGRGRIWLRHRVERLVRELGWTAEHEAFWMRRAAEALVGLAADQLQLAGQVHSARELAVPDLECRARRLRRLVGRFPVRRSTLAARRALQPWRRPPFVVPGPRTLLAHAVSLAPLSAAGWLWMFEACAADDDFVAAARALRRARRCDDVEPAAQVLARARLLEQRDRLPAGLALLRRAQRRSRGESPLLRAASTAARLAASPSA